MATFWKRHVEEEDPSRIRAATDLDRHRIVQGVATLIVEHLKSAPSVAAIDRPLEDDVVLRVVTARPSLREGQQGSIRERQQRRNPDVRIGIDPRLEDHDRGDARDRRRFRTGARFGWIGRYDQRKQPQHRDEEVHGHTFDGSWPIVNHGGGWNDTL